MTTAALTTAALTTAVISAQGLACRRGRRLLFRGLNLQLGAGTVTWLRGANGSGKTSLLRILAGLSAPADGQVQRGASGLIYIGHSNALKDDLSLVEALAFLATLAGLDASRRRAQQALERMGLGTRRDAPVRTLSQGQRRRGALARLLLDEAPRVWLLDEPFDALDAASRAGLVEVIQAHARRRGCVLLTSHQAVEIDAAQVLNLEAWCVAA